MASRLTDGHLAPLEVDLLLLATLAHNLGIAAALCKAWRLGYHYDGAVFGSPKHWRPGCGEVAP
jgi:hypothetical protein